MTCKTPKSALRRAFGLAVAVLFVAAFGDGHEMSAKRQSDLLYVLEQDCGSCHGLTLKGGLGPALLPEHLKGRDTGDLAEIILDGVPGTPMPPWRPLINEREALWLAQVLKSGDR